MKNNAPNPSPDEDNDIDDEIIEVFIEEAGEVKDTLDEYFPKWRDDFQDQDSLIIVRRAFHTLKGSGRMVQANDIGELAWSVENMLNRVIDRTVAASYHHIHLIECVLAIVPSLIEAFEGRKANPQPELTQQYMAWGDALAAGNTPDELAAPASAGDTTVRVEQPEQTEPELVAVEDLKPEEKLTPVEQEAPKPPVREKVTKIRPSLDDTAVGKTVEEPSASAPVKERPLQKEPAAKVKPSPARPKPSLPTQDEKKADSSMMPWLVGLMVVGLIVVAAVIFLD